MPKRINVLNYHRQVLKHIDNTKQFLQTYRRLNSHNQDLKAEKLLREMEQIERLDPARSTEFEAKIIQSETEEQFKMTDLDHILLTNPIAVRHWKMVLKIDSTEELKAFWDKLRWKKIK